MASPVVAINQSSAVHLRSASFDWTFVVGLPVLGLLSALIVITRPSLWGPVLALDIWFLGYHHVISTYTRMGLGASPDTNARLLWALFPVTALAVFAIGAAGGSWALTTTYLYWQWWHYSRQSWGISRVYSKKSGRPMRGNPQIVMACFYLVPLWGILHRSSQRPDTFLGLELKVIPVPSWLVAAVGALACVGVVYESIRHIAAWRDGQLAILPAVYLATHHLMFMSAYVLIDDINYGWLAINIWHNAQYIGFVWLFNSKRFASSDSKSPLSRASQRPSMFWYVAGCFAVSTVAYLVLASTIAAVVAPILVYQTINFHHYIVDSKIWKVRTNQMQRTLELAPDSA